MKTEPQKADQTERMTTLGVAQERGKRIYAELKTADDAMAAQLLAAWKELIMDELVKLLRVTKDPLVLQVLDENVAIGQEFEFGSRGRISSSGTDVTLQSKTPKTHE
jgi:hypothetical protein